MSKRCPSINCVQIVSKRCPYFYQMSKKYPNLWTCFGHLLNYCPKFLEMSNQCPKYVQNVSKIWQKLWTCFGHVHYFPKYFEMSKQCPKYVHNVSKICPCLADSARSVERSTPQPGSLHLHNTDRPMTHHARSRETLLTLIEKNHPHRQASFAHRSRCLLTQRSWQTLLV